MISLTHELFMTKYLTVTLNRNNIGQLHGFMHLIMVTFNSLDAMCHLSGMHTYSPCHMLLKWRVVKVMVTLRTTKVALRKKPNFTVNLPFTAHSLAGHLS